MTYDPATLAEDAVLYLKTGRAGEALGLIRALPEAIAVAVMEARQDAIQQVRHRSAPTTDVQTEALPLKAQGHLEAERDRLHNELYRRSLRVDALRREVRRLGDEVDRKKAALQKLDDEIRDRRRIHARPASRTAQKPRTKLK